VRDIVIGITMSRSRSPEGRLRDWLGTSYTDALAEAGAIPVLIPNHTDPLVLARLDGLLLSGGGDYAPARFGEEDQGTNWPGVSEERDDTELALLQAAPDDFPVLGICRGIQGLAVGFGGTLIQDLPRTRPSPIRHTQEEDREAATHAVTIAGDSHLRGILGTESASVNSFHHQAVDRVPDDFRPVAWAPDGVVEGIEHVVRPFCLGVQWHPENLVGGQEHARRLFAALVEAAVRYRGERA
jgi:putative glutamine amidotransferase